MWSRRENMHASSSGEGEGGGGAGGRERSVAVAIDKDKTSQSTLRWALDHIVSKDGTLKLIHVKERPTFPHPSLEHKETKQLIDKNAMELFLSFRCFCRRRQVQCETIILEDSDVAKGLIEYVCQNRVETLLLGSSSKNGLSRIFRTTDIPGSVLKSAPDFCTVYVISKGKINTVRNATRPIRTRSASEASMFGNPDMSVKSTPHIMGGSERCYDEISAVDFDNPAAPSGRASTDSSFCNFYADLGCELSGEESPKGSNVIELSYSLKFDPTHVDNNNNNNSNSNRLDNGRASWSSLLNNMEEYEDELKRLKTELKQTIDMYHAACREALAAKQKVIELEEWKIKEQKRIKEAHVTEENAIAMVEREKTKSNIATGATEAVQKLVEMEVQKRLHSEMKALKEMEEKHKVLDDLGQSHIVLKYQSLFHIVVVLILFYFYFLLFK